MTRSQRLKPVEYSREPGLINVLASHRSGTGCLLVGLLGVGAEYGILMPYARVQESEAEGQGRPSGCIESSTQ